MIVILKKTGVIAATVVAASIILIVIMAKSAPGVSSKVIISKNSVIVIDAGHGGLDGGALSPDGMCEKDYNLSVAKEVQKLLEKSGMKTVMTRTEDDIDLKFDENQTPLERKRKDLNYRKTLPKKKKADLLITIHMNKFQNTSAHGAQVFYDNVYPVSQKIAASIQKELIKLDNSNKRQIKAADTSIYLFKSPYVPTVLVECGFLSNPREESKLRTKGYQKKLAKCIYNGIMNYLNDQAKEKNTEKTAVIFSKFE